MLAFLWWLIIGLVAGALARLLVPGPQPMGMFVTMCLGLLGSLVGGFLSSLLFRYNPGEPGLHASGLFMSTVGAVLMLAIYLQANKGRRI